MRHTYCKFEFQNATAESFKIQQFCAATNLSLTLCTSYFFPLPKKEQGLYSFYTYSKRGNLVTKCVCVCVVTRFPYLAALLISLERVRE